jgi:hypothetical protein
MSTRHGRDTAVLSLSRPYHRKQHSLIRGATPPPASDPFGSQPRQQPSARKASSTSARRSRPSSRWKCCSQPKMRSTTQEAPTSEPCSVWRRGALRCVVGSRLDPAYAKPTPSRVQPCHKQRVASRPSSGQGLPEAGRAASRRSWQDALPEGLVALCHHAERGRSARVACAHGCDDDDRRYRRSEP